MHWRCNATSSAMVVKLESLVVILDVEKTINAQNPNDFFNVILTKDSAQALAKVETLKVWEVGHTMVRGQKKLPEVVAEGTVDGKKRAPKRKPKAKAAEAAPLEEEEAITEESIRRSTAGRSAIKVLMRQLFLLDSRIFATAPAFDLEGRCRLKLPGASNVTWNQVLEASPQGIECLCLGCSGVGLVIGLEMG